jgi:VIT1/CCC1 family predicted Fe2+/Mn2+ transporter
MQAALASAVSYASGALLPLLAVLVVPHAWLLGVVSVGSLVLLAVLGAIAAQAGGASITAGALRVLVWGAFALAVTAGVGALFGAAG